jgi:S-adenosylmethionine:tRNA ribosyltransferase-isomerase
MIADPAAMPRADGAATGPDPMLLADLDYALPPHLIAQEPTEPRDASRLLVYSRPPMGAAGRPGATGGQTAVGVADAAARVVDRHFRDLPELLRAGDLLVRNDTRVLAARTHFRRPTGGRLELLFLHPAGKESAEEASDTAGEVWEALVRGRPRTGETLTNESDGRWLVRVLHSFGDGRWLVGSEGATPVGERLMKCGEAPLPPYIRRRLDDPERYQTTYSSRPGSSAAPTAGLHFTRELDERLAAAGVDVVNVTLHVGLGTFKPLADDVVEQNRLHAETYEVDAAAWARVRAARAEDRRVVAVGTTVVRTLEHLANAPEIIGDADGRVLRGSSDLFITPGFHFRVVDALITNFHLPRTSLLALVMAFAGIDETRTIYRHAVEEGYRFYSLGDAMVIL